MRINELVEIGSILVLCGAGIVYALVDLFKQLKEYDEYREKSNGGK